MGDSLTLGIIAMQKRYDPHKIARLDTDGIKNFIKDVFPEMYDEAGSPDFVVKDYLENNAMGKVKSSMYKKGGKYTRIKYDGNVY